VHKYTKYTNSKDKTFDALHFNIKKKNSFRKIGIGMKVNWTGT